MELLKNIFSKKKEKTYDKYVKSDVENTENYQEILRKLFYKNISRKQKPYENIDKEEIKDFPGKVFEYQFSFTDKVDLNKNDDKVYVMIDNKEIGILPKNKKFLYKKLDKGIVTATIFGGKYLKSGKEKDEKFTVKITVKYDE